MDQLQLLFVCVFLNASVQQQMYSDISDKNIPVALLGFPPRRAGLSSWSRHGAHADSSFAFFCPSTKNKGDLTGVGYSW